MKKVSVIVPMYKAKNYVKPCVDALLRQGLEDEIEILLIDDRSPDDTFEYAKNLYKDNPLVRVILQEENGGPGKARNRGLEEASGKYICFADVDDMYVDNSISGMLEIAEKEDADVVHFNGMHFTVVNPIPDDLSSLTKEDLVNSIFTMGNRDIHDTNIYLSGNIEERIDEWFKHEYHWSVWGKLYKKSFLDENKIRFLNMKIGEDCLFIMKCVMTAKTYVRKNDFAYIYRIGEAESVSRGKGNPRIFINAQRSVFEVERHFTEEFSDIPYFKDHKEELERLLKMEIDGIVNSYAAAKLHEIGREELGSNPDVIALFEEYYGDQAKEKMNEVFDEYEKRDGSTNADQFSSYNTWKFVKDKIGDEIISLGDKFKIFR